MSRAYLCGVRGSPLFLASVLALAAPSAWAGCDSSAPVAGQTGTTLSLEAGKPLLQFGQSAWWLEPQVQVIWQRSSLDDQRDAVSAVSFDSDNAWTGRVGLRLAADYQLADNGWQPYFKLHYWYGRSGEDRVQFDTDVITSAQRSRALEAGIGVAGRFNRTISAYAVADYTREVGGSRNEERRVIEGNIGLRADW